MDRLQALSSPAPPSASPASSSRTFSFFPPPFRISDYDPTNSTPVSGFRPRGSPSSRPSSPAPFQRSDARSQSRPRFRSASIFSRAEDEEQLHQARKRHESVQRLKTWWDKVYDKYSAIPPEEDDEVDLWTGRVYKDRGKLRSLERTGFGELSEAEVGQEELDASSEPVFGSDEDELGDWDERSGLDRQTPAPDEEIALYRPPTPIWTREDDEDLEEFMRLEEERKRRAAMTGDGKEDDEGYDDEDETGSEEAKERSASPDETFHDTDQEDETSLRSGMRTSDGLHISSTAPWDVDNSEDELQAMTSDAEEATRTIPVQPSDPSSPSPPPRPLAKRPANLQLEVVIPLRAASIAPTPVNATLDSLFSPVPHEFDTPAPHEATLRDLFTPPPHGPSPQLAIASLNPLVREQALSLAPSPAGSSRPSRRRRRQKWPGGSATALFSSAVDQEVSVVSFRRDWPSAKGKERMAGERPASVDPSTPAQAISSSGLDSKFYYSTVHSTSGGGKRHCVACRKAGGERGDRSMYCKGRMGGARCLFEQELRNGEGLMRLQISPAQPGPATAGRDSDVVPPRSRRRNTVPRETSPSVDDLESLADDEATPARLSYPSQPASGRSHTAVLSSPEDSSRDNQQPRPPKVSSPPRYSRSTATPAPQLSPTTPSSDASLYHSSTMKTWYSNQGKAFMRRCAFCKAAGGERAERAAYCKGRVWSAQCGFEDQRISYRAATAPPEDRANDPTAHSPHRQTPMPSSSRLRSPTTTPAPHRDSRTSQLDTAWTPLRATSRRPSEPPERAGSSRATPTLSSSKKLYYGKNGKTPRSCRPCRLAGGERERMAICCEGRTTWRKCRFDGESLGRMSSSGRTICTDYDCGRTASMSTSHHYATTIDIVRRDMSSESTPSRDSDISARPQRISQPFERAGGKRGRRAQTCQGSRASRPYPLEGRGGDSMGDTFGEYSSCNEVEDFGSSLDQRSMAYITAQTPESDPSLGRRQEANSDHTESSIPSAVPISSALFRKRKRVILTSPSPPPLACESSNESLTSPARPGALRSPLSSLPPSSPPEAYRTSQRTQSIIRPLPSRTDVFVRPTPSPSLSAYAPKDSSPLWQSSVPPSSPLARHDIRSRTVAAMPTPSLTASDPRSSSTASDHLPSAIPRRGILRLPSETGSTEPRSAKRARFSLSLQLRSPPREDSSEPFDAAGYPQYDHEDELLLGSAISPNLAVRPSASMPRYSSSPFSTEISVRAADVGFSLARHTGRIPARLLQALAPSFRPTLGSAVLPAVRSSYTLPSPPTSAGPVAIASGGDGGTTAGPGASVAGMRRSEKRASPGASASGKERLVIRFSPSPKGLMLPPPLPVKRADSTPTRPRTPAPIDSAQTVRPPVRNRIPSRSSSRSRSRSLSAVSVARPTTPAPVDVDLVVRRPSTTPRKVTRAERDLARLARELDDDAGLEWGMDEEAGEEVGRLWREGSVVKYLE